MEYLALFVFLFSCKLSPWLQKIGEKVLAVRGCLAVCKSFVLKILENSACFYKRIILKNKAASTYDQA